MTFRIADVRMSAMFAVFFFRAAVTRFRLPASAIAAVASMWMLMSGHAFAETAVSGVLNADAHWEKSRSPYVVSGEFRVSSGATLSIDPGVAIYMDHGATVTVEQGSVIARGTSADPVLVSSVLVLRGGAPAKGDYGAWTFSAGTAPSTHLAHVVFEYGSGLTVHGASPVFDDLTIRRQRGAAISVDLDASPSGRHNVASDNDVNGVSVPAGDITGNISWGLQGIPYIVESGFVSVGETPVVTNIAPQTVLQGETTVVTVSGKRLGGLDRVVSANPGLSFEVLPGGSANEARVSIVATDAASTGAADLTLRTDAGLIERKNALSVVPPQPVLETLSPQTLYAHQPVVHVRLTGRHFRAESKVLVDGVEQAHPVPEATTVSFDLLPPAQAGSLHIQMRTPTGDAGEPYLSNMLELPVLGAGIVATPVQLALDRGQSARYTLEIPYAAPLGGVSIALAAIPSSAIQMQALAVIPEGQRTVEVEATGLSGGSGSIRASAQNFIDTEIPFVVAVPPRLAFRTDGAIFRTNTTQRIHVSVPSIAGEGGIAVSLTSNDPTIAAVPALVRIPAGQSEVELDVATGAAGTATVHAEAAGFDPRDLEVVVRAGTLDLSKNVWLEKGASRSLSVTSSEPAPAGGLTVNLQTDSPGILTLPESVVIPEGQTQASFAVTLGHTWKNFVSITASAQGFAEKIALVRALEPMTFAWDNGNAGPVLYVPQGESIGYTLNVGNSDWSTEPLVLTLSSSEPAIAGVNERIELSAPLNGGNGTVTLHGAASGETTIVVRGEGMVDRSITVVVLANPTLRFARADQVVGIGMSTDPSVNRVEFLVDGQPFASQYAMPTPVLTSSDPSVGVTMTSSGQIVLHGVGNTPMQSVAIDAQAKGFHSPTEKLTVSLVRPTLSFENLDQQRYIGDPDDFADIRLSVPEDNSGRPQVARAPLQIALELNQLGGDSGSRLTAGAVVVPVGYARTSFQLSAPTAVGRYSVTASAAGAISATSDPVSVDASAYRLAVTDVAWNAEPKQSIAVGEGMRRSVYLSRMRNDTWDYAANPLPLTLRCVPEIACSIQASATIPAGNSGVDVWISNVQATSGSAPVLQVTANGYAPIILPLETLAIKPELHGVNPVRGIGARPDGFVVRLVGEHGEELVNHQPLAPIRVDLAVVEQSPEAVVPGIVGYPGGIANAGEESPQALDHFDMTTMETNEYEWAGRADVSVASPTQSGTYRVKASLSNGVSTMSERTLVQGASTLRFEASQLRIGRGFYATAYLVREFEGSPATTGNLPLQVSCVPSSACTASATSFADGESRIGIDVNAIGLTGAAPAVLRISGVGVQPVELPIVVVDPELRVDLWRRSSDLSIPEQNIAWIGLHWDNDAILNTHPLPGYRIRYSLVEAEPSNVVPGLYSTTNPTPSQTGEQWASQYGDVTVNIAAPTVPGHYRIKAEVVATPVVTGDPIAIPPMLSDEVVVVADSYALSMDPQVRVGKGMVQSVRIEQRRGGEYWYGNANDQQLSLRCEPANKCSVPATATIPAYSSTTYVEVTGLESTGSEPAHLIVQPVGYGVEREASMAVQVESPVVSAVGIETSRFLGEAPDQFFLQALAADGEYIGNFPSTVNVAWRLVESTRPDIVNVVDQADGAPETSVDRLYFDHVYGVGVPITPGNYRIAFSGDALPEFVSEPVSVASDGPRALSTGGDVVIRDQAGQSRRYAFIVKRLIGGRPHRSSEALTVQLSCTPVAICVVPATITIPAGASEVSVPLETSSDFPNAQATLVLSAEGYDTTAVAIKFQILEPM